MRVYVLDGGGPKDSENTLNSFLTKRDGNAFWQIGADMFIFPAQKWHEKTTQGASKASATTTTTRHFSHLATYTIQATPLWAA